MDAMEKKIITDLDLKGKRVLIRVDFNVPMDKATGEITDDNRIRAALPTIEHAIRFGARVILMSHLGRPKGKVDPKYSLEKVAVRLGELLGKPVAFCPEFVGEKALKMAHELGDGEVLLLENTRFEPGEEKNDPDLAKTIASMGDLHVNDAFGTAHRAHASNVGVAQHLVSAAGFLMEKEIAFLGKVVENPEKPYVAILGGAKVSDKIGVIENLLKKADKLLIGGAMMFTFWKALGYKTGQSLVEADKVELARQLIDQAKNAGVDLMIPTDALAAEKMESGSMTKVCTAREGIPEGLMGLDIGPDTIHRFKNAMQGAKTVVWNGPMGVFEIDDFAQGTREIAKTLASLSQALTVIGGGDSAAAIEQFGLADRVTHVSTGGGASLEMLEGKEMPGVASIASKKKRKIWIAGNWKMNKTSSEGVEFAQALIKGCMTLTDQVEAVLCPPFVCLPGVVNACQGSAMKVGAQNMHPEDKGAFTGEISAPMLKDLGVTHVILGHSERRAIFGEIDGFICEKVKSALDHDLIPVFCVGEVLLEREEGKTFDVLEDQLRLGLKDLSIEQAESLVVAYEPVWAIGTGKVATADQAQEAIAYIRSVLAEIFDQATASQISILYGGSITPENFRPILSQPDVDGGLVGGASLKESFLELIQIAKELT